MANAIAVIGWSGGFPGEPSIEAFRRGRAGGGAGEAVSGATAGSGGPAVWIGPARRFSGCLQDALQDAGYATRLNPERTGVFAGADSGAAMLGGEGLAAEAAEAVGLRGPAVAVSSDGPAVAAAVERACASLLAGECDLALAGRFSAHAEEVGVVALKRLPAALADGDRAVAVIGGGATHPAGTAGAVGGGVVLEPLAALPAAAGGAAAVRERPVLATAYAQPSNRLEEAIARVWQEQLGIERIGVDDNFFELGGTSVAGVQIVSALQAWLCQEIPTVSLYEGPTVSALARVLLHTGPAHSYDAVRERGERRRRKLQRVAQGPAASLGSAD